MQWDNLSKRWFLYINCLIITVLSSRPWISSSKTREISTLGGPNFSQSAVLSTLSWWRQLLNPWERCSDRWRSVKLKWHSWTCIYLTSMHKKYIVQMFFLLFREFFFLYWSNLMTSLRALGKFDEHFIQYFYVLIIKPLIHKTIRQWL